MYSNHPLHGPNNQGDVFNVSNVSMSHWSGFAFYHWIQYHGNFITTKITNLRGICYDLLFVPTIWSTPIVVLGSNRPVPRKSLLMGSKLQWTTLVSKKAPSNWFVQISLTKWGEIRWVSSRAKSFFCWWNLTSEKVGDWIYIFLKSNFTTTSCKWYIYIDMSLAK